MMNKDFVKKYVPNRVSLAGWVIIGIGFLFIGSGFTKVVDVFNGISNAGNLLSILFTMGFGVLSLGLAFVSIGIAEKSTDMAEDSDKRIKDIANANFLNVLSRFEDRRIDLQYHPLRDKIHPILIWKALVDLREAEELLKFCDIEVKHQRRLIDLLNHLLSYVHRDFFKVLWCEEVAHLLSMGLIGLKLNNELAGNKNEMLGRIDLFYDETKVKVNEEFIKWMLGATTKDIYRVEFIKMKDKFIEQYLHK